MKNAAIMSLLLPVSGLLSADHAWGQQAGGAVDLLKRYPTTLTEGSKSAGEAQAWEFTAADIYHLSEFRLHIGDSLHIEGGQAGLGLGHCPEGAVWSVVLPTEKARLTGSAVPKPGEIAHIWLRFHPNLISELFPAATVRAGGDRSLASRIRQIAGAKFHNSWFVDDRVVIPDPKDLIVDLDTTDGVRRFFIVDRSLDEAGYFPEFEFMPVPELIEPWSREVAEASFKQLKQAFDAQYAMFKLRKEVDWDALCEAYRPKALECKTARDFAEMCAKMLANLGDLHVGVIFEGTQLEVFDRPRTANANPAAHESIIGSLSQAGADIRWGKTKDNIGFVSVSSWNDPKAPELFDQVLDNLRDTVGLVIDVRLNAGGDEALARKVAERFADQELVYAYHQTRSGPGPTDLSDKVARTVQPRGLWRYQQPVMVLMGQKCMGSNESFIDMMAQCPQVTTMGERTAGSSGNPTTVELPAGVTVSVPRWIDYRADGQPLDGRGIEPDVPFEASPESSAGMRDDLLAAALKRLTPETRAAAETRQAKPAAEAAQPGEGQPKPPVVVEVHPEPGLADAEPITEIRVRFDQPMNPALTFLQWGEGFFTPVGPWRYLANTHEFAMPVELKPFEPQRIAVNPRLGSLPIQGFRSVDGTLAETFEWTFHTRRDMDDTEAPEPQVVSIEPPPGSLVGRIAPIKITFDQPMSPHHFHGIARKAPEKDPVGQTCFHLRYIEDQNQFVIPVALPPNWSGTLELHGFRSRSRRHAMPVSISYSTGLKPFSDEHLEQLGTAGRSREFGRLLSEIRSARAAITSLEEVVSITRYTRSELGIFGTVQSAEAVFRMDGGRRFYGNVSSMLNAPFIVGSDGHNGWCYSKSDAGLQVVSCPLDEVHYRKVMICDLFQLTQVSPAAAITEMNLEYLGTDSIDGRPCHVVQGWYGRADGEDLSAHVARWWIDSRTFLPVQVVQEWGSASKVVQKFDIRKINESMAAADFSPPTGEHIKQVPPEPLNDDYSSRFLNVVDASIGRMSVRWGRTGSAGHSARGIK